MEKKTVQAVYENGVLRPLEPIPLEDRQEVTVTISGEGDIPRDHPLVASPDEWADAAGDSIILGPECAGYHPGFAIRSCDLRTPGSLVPALLSGHHCSGEALYGKELGSDC